MDNTDTSVTKTIRSGVLWLSGNTVLLKLVGLASIFVVLRKLGTYDYGLAELILSLVPLLSIFSLPGLSNTVIADMAVERGKKEFGRMKALFHGFFLYQLVFGVVGWLIMFLCADSIARFYQTEAVSLIRVVSFLFLVSPFRTMVTVLLTVDLKYFEQAVFSIAEECIKFSLILFLIVGLDMKASGLVYATVLSQFGALFFIFPAVIRSYASFRRAHIPVAFSFLRYVGPHGKWGILLSYLGNFNQKIWVWIIQFFVGTEAVGLFAVAQGLIGHTLSLVPLNRVVTPLLPQYLEKEEIFFRIANKSIKYQFLAYSLLMVVAAVCFPPIINYLFPAYSEAMSLFYVMLLSLIPISFDSVFIPMFYAIKAQKNLFWATVYKTILILITASVCLYIWGFIGSAIAFDIVVLLYSINRYRALRRVLPRFRLFLRDFWSINEYDRIVLQNVLQPVRTIMERLGFLR